MLVPTFFHDLSMGIIKSNSKRKATKADETRFITAFGASTIICAELWCLIANADILVDQGMTPQPMHLFYALHLLFVYDNESNNASFFGCNEKMC